MSLFAAACIFGVSTGGVFAQNVPPAIAELKDPAEIERVQQLIDGAKKEGRLSWLGLFIEPQHGQALIEGFKKHYGLQDHVIEYSYQDSGLIVTQTEQLLSANRDVPDIIWTVAWAWYTDLLNRGELLEYHSPYHAEYTLSKQAGLSKEGYWVSDGHFFTPIYSPSGLAKHGVENFEPKSLADLIDPRIRGLASIPNIPGSTSNSPAGIGWLKAMGEEWYFELAKVVQPVLRGGSAQGRDWVGSGEYPISLMSHAKDAQTLWERNVDVKVMYPKEGIVMLPFAPVIMKKGKNPNTAKLFIDFAASARGAQIRMDAGVLMFYGRPGIESINRELLTSWEETPVAEFDWDVDGSLETLAKFRDMFVRTGLGE
ncbi:ABC transporter substrate-binding protein [Pseudochelatococcus sp. B33]